MKPLTLSILLTLSGCASTALDTLPGRVGLAVAGTDWIAP